MQKFFQMLKNDRAYKYTWNGMIIFIIVATFMTGILTTGIIPLEVSGLYIGVLFLCLVLATITAILYYIIRVIRSEKKEKQVVYYKRGKK